MELGWQILKSAGGKRIAHFEKMKTSSEQTANTQQAIALETPINRRTFFQRFKNVLLVFAGVAVGAEHAGIEDFLQLG